jgi:hypothetical protein
MATRRGSPDRLGESRSTGPTARLDQFTQSARAAREADDAALAARLERVRGLGCPDGDMRLAYGWRAAVVTAALVAALVGVTARLLLTGLFVEFVTGDVVPVTGFNLGITVLATLTLGLVRARRFRLAVHHALLPVRRSLRRRYARWRRTARQRRRHRRARVAYRCRRALQAGSRLVRTGVRRRRHRHARVVSQWRRVFDRWRRQLRLRLRTRRRHRRLVLVRARRWGRGAVRRAWSRLRRRRDGRAGQSRRRATVLALVFGR